MIDVRFFAGAAEAAGDDSRIVALDPGATLADLTTQLGEGNERLTRVLAASTYLVDGVVTTDRATAIPDGVRVDVLPPFAGG